MDIYQNMWEKAAPQLRAGNVKTDAFINDPSDNRRGITLRYRPSELILKQVNNFLNAAFQIENELYRYPFSDIHMTILSIISCYPNFDLKLIQPQSYISIIEECVREMPPIQLRFNGITASQSSILVQGYDESGSLEILRNRLREAFKNSTLQQSVDHRYVLKTAHLTVIRFKSPLKKANEFYKFLNNQRTTLFGTCDVKQIELVFNDWYHTQENLNCLKRFEL